MESEGITPRRLAVAGIVLAGGLVFGVILAGTFRWSPYYWQWLAYHNGLVALVVIYLLLSASKPGRSRRARLPPPPAVTMTRSVGREDVTLVYPLEWE